MYKRINQILNILIGCFIGIFIGYGIYIYWDYKTHPDLYTWQSAPWYTSILLYGLLTIVILIVIFVIKFILRKKIK